MASPGLHGHGFEIVRYRGQRGRFTSLRQPDEVPGLVGKIDGVGTQFSVEGPNTANATASAWAP